MSTAGPLHVVLRTALFSRLLLLTLICFWRLLLHPYDTSSSLNPPCLAGGRPSPPVSPLWPRVGSAIERSVVWDGVYFVRIAECGYEYEQTYAFFPILPICISLLSRSVFAPLVPIVGYRAVLALSGYVLNNVAFVLAAMYFYRFSVVILKDPRDALRASVLFCFNPASIFYSSVYSESLYALFSFGGLFHLFTGSNTKAVVLFALSGSARSNGMLNAGYFCFQAMHQAYDAVTQKHTSILAVQVTFIGIVRTMCTFIPFVTFQAYGYFNICVESSGNELRPWCKARIPRLYDYIQGHYWGVGFMRYFQVKQLPNFLLASPMLSLAVFSVACYTRLRPDIVFSLGFQASREETRLAAMLSSCSTGQQSDGTYILQNDTKVIKEHVTLRQRKQEKKDSESTSLDKLESTPQPKQGYCSILVAPFIYHLSFLTVTALFVMHVQVATRFLSASPPIYWFVAHVISSSRRIGCLIWVYFSLYILLGSLLFANFYPFT